MKGSPRPHWTDGPHDSLFALLSPLLGPDAEDDEAFVDHFARAGDMPSIAETLSSFNAGDGLPEWWPTNADLRRSAGLRELGRDVWESEAQRRAVLSERLREQLRPLVTAPRTFAERQRVVTALQIVFAGLRDQEAGWLRQSD